MSAAYDVVAPHENGTLDAPPGSALARVRAAAARQREEQTRDFAVGGAFGEHLLIRYGTVPVDELDRYSELGDSVGRLSLGLDLMVQACRTLLWREGDELVDLDVQLEPALWTLLDWPLPAGVENVNDLTAREIIGALFGRNALALGTHLGEVVPWMQNPGGVEPGES